MNRISQTLQINKTARIDPYEDLANAIIVQAVEDYRNNKGDIGEIEDFFKSDWFKVLTNIDGKWLLRKLQSEKRGVIKEVDKHGLQTRNG